MRDVNAKAGRIGALILVALLLLGGIVGFLDGSDDSTSQELRETSDEASTDAVTSSASGAAAGPPTTFAPSPAAGAGRASSAPAADTFVPSSAAVNTGTDQKIVKNATIRVEVGKNRFREAFDATSRVAGSHGGFVISSESSAEKDNGANGVLVLRVPVAAFDAVRAELGKLGEVKDERINGTDVSGQIVDLDARLRSLAAQEDAIRTLMAKARTIGETVEVQNHLTQVRQQIEQLSGEKARLENQAALSTIRVELAEPGAALVEERQPEPSALREALSTAVDGTETVIAGTIIVLGWAIPLALLALVGWLAYRPIRNRTNPRPAA